MSSLMAGRASRSWLRTRHLMREHARLAISAAIVTAVWLLGAAHWIVKGAVVPWDSKNQFYAFFRFLSATLHAGDWPFWNPYHYGGHPSVADPQSLVFSPIFIVWAALDPAPSMRAFDLVVLVHLLAGGFAIAALGCRAGWPVASCVLAAVLYMFGGAASGRLQHTGIVLGYGLFPVALLLLELALERRSHLLAIGFALTAASVALGRNQVALLLCLFLLAAAAGRVVSARRPQCFLRERWSVLTTMALIGAAVALVPVLLTLQFAELSNRPVESLADALRGSLYPANLATLAVANVFGTHGEYWGPGAATLSDVALTDDSENYLFFGAVPVLFVIWLGAAGVRAWQPGRRLMAATAVIACLFMLGRYTPFYAAAFRFLPGIDFFRRPTDASFLLGIAFAILCGHLLSDYVRHGLPRIRPLIGMGAMSAWLAIVASAVAFSARTGHVADALGWAALASVIMVTAGVIMAAAHGPAARVKAAGIVTVIAVAELLWWNTASRLNAESEGLYAVLQWPTGDAARAINVLEAAIAADHRRRDYPRVEVLGLGGPWQNLAMVRGWEAINGYNPLRIGIYDRLVAPGEENWNVAQRQFPPSFDGYSSPLARSLGLTYLVLGAPVDRFPGLGSASPAELLLSGPPIWIYRLPGALPRARLSSLSAPDDSLAPLPERLLPPLPDHASTDEQTSSSRLSARATLESPGVVEITSLKPGKVEAVATLEANGRLVLHDSYYPGWAAEVDGHPAPIFRANDLFRAVDVPAGTHHVVFRFNPFSLGNLRAALSAVVGQATPVNLKAAEKRATD